MNRILNLPEKILDEKQGKQEWNNSGRFYDNELKQLNEVEKKKILSLIFEAEARTML